MTRHFLPDRLSNGRIEIALVGCGGNGAQMAMGLASLDLALREISPRFLEVTIIDDDVVSEANLGRQPFYRCDIGRPKAHVMAERLNLAHGLQWKAVKGRAPDALRHVRADMLISCVDTAAARRSIGEEFEHCRNYISYWLDLGNRATDGQYVIGTKPGLSLSKTSPALPTVLEHFPELADELAQEDDRPSCSVAEALERQSLFINRVIASHALALLFELLGRGSIGFAGGFVNLASGQHVPISLKSI